MSTRARRRSITETHARIAQLGCPLLPGDIRRHEDQGRDQRKRRGEHEHAVDRAGPPRAMARQERDQRERAQLGPGEGGRHPMPATADFEKAMRLAGVSDGRPVVVYDDADSTAAARAWWLLRYFGHPSVRVLDGRTIEVDCPDHRLLIL